MSVKEPVQVYCRMRPVSNQNEVTCIQKVSPSTVQMSSPETAVNFREGCLKETLYSFSYVFDGEASQTAVFEKVALPMVDGFLHGRNGLLLTYGITGSGKTHTMTGTPLESGIMPRALDVIFNSIGDLQAKRFVFKPDRLNGFEVQNEQEAKIDEHQLKNRNFKTPRSCRSEWANRPIENTKIEDICKDNSYAVFVTYIEIYNNSVYDLLDENFEEMSARFRMPQSKMVREDGAKNMYVHGVTEVEVKSMKEAFEVFHKGSSRKRMAHNSLNAESSRSHSIFTLRLIQIPLDKYGENMLYESTCISISQLSFVDLAGSERTSRTNTSGERLREAGNINNSLMNLRNCLQILRENQMNGTNKLVPYRGSKLTHLFKNYFDGACLVRVIICINPRTDDYDENVQVMKFAEMSQDVQVAKPMPLRMAGRHRANQIFKHAMVNLNSLASARQTIPVEVGVPIVYGLASQFPDLFLNGPEDDRLLKNIMIFLEIEIVKKKKVDAEIESKCDEFRNMLIETEQQLDTLTHKNKILSADLELSKEKTATLEKQLVKAQVEISSLKKQIVNYQRIIKSQEEELEIRNKGKKLREMKRILPDEAISTPSCSGPSYTYNLPSETTASVDTTLYIPATVTIRKKGDVVPTCGGGEQVILNDVEILKQKSPSSSPTRKRTGNTALEVVEDRCHVAMEGHAKRSKQ